MMETKETVDIVGGNLAGRYGHDHSRGTRDRVKAEQFQ